MLTEFFQQIQIKFKLQKIDKISYDEMLELSSLGAKVMQSSAVQTAMIYDIPLEVKSTFTERKGTKILTKKILIIQKVSLELRILRMMQKLPLQV